MGVKSKLGRVIFRKIGGRIIPIRIKNTVDKNLTMSTWTKFRNLTAYIKDADGISSKVGDLTLKIPDKGKTAELVDVHVLKEYRKKGIAKHLFKRATTFLERAGFKFLRSSEIQHVAQAKVRNGFGRYKAGSKNKNRTKYFADQFGRYGEQSKRVSYDDAKFYLKQNKGPNSTGRLIRATTMLKGRKK